MIGAKIGDASLVTELGRIVLFGIVLVVIGVIFLLDSLGITTLGFHELWPIVLITAGLLIVVERFRRRYRRR